MELNKMSPLELVESLQKYPANEYPDEYESIKIEIERRRKQHSQTKSSNEGAGQASAGKQFLTSWTKRKLISTGITVVLSLMFGWQLISGMREPSQAGAILGIVLISYVYSTLRIELLMKNEGVLESLNSAETDSEVKAIIKGALWQKLFVILSYAGLGAVYVLL